MERVELTSLGQISEADISFGDLTVFVGEQAICTAFDGIVPINAVRRCKKKQ